MSTTIRFPSNKSKSISTNHNREIIYFLYEKTRTKLFTEL